MFEKNPSELIVVPEKSNLFDKVVSILEQARLNVVKSVNSNMIIAYWLIGRAIVYEIQGGEERAEYGKRVVTELSKKLNIQKRIFYHQSLVFQTVLSDLFNASTSHSPQALWRIAL